MRTFFEYIKLHEEEAEFDPHGLPKCPDCHSSLGYEEDGNRDRETMGGHEIRYLKCDKCNTEWELIDRQLFAHGDRF